MEPRKQKLRPKWKNIQAREAWADRAAVLYLRNPALFMMLTEVPGRWNTFLRGTEALEQCGGLPSTGYRLQLLNRACQAYLRTEILSGTQLKRAATYHSKGIA